MAGRHSAPEAARWGHEQRTIRMYAQVSPFRVGFRLLRLWDRIMTATVKRVALEESSEGEPASARGTVLADRLNSILRARWDESTPPREERGDDPLIGDDRCDQ